MRHANHRHLPGLLRLFVAIDARRPASWITLAIGAWAGRCAAAVPDGLAAAGMIAMLSASVAAVAAIGDLPLDLCPPATGSARRGLVFLWAGERVAWPLGGVMLGMLSAGAAPALLPTLVLVARSRSRCRQPLVPDATMQSQALAALGSRQCCCSVLSPAR
jgi:hypothetical protein